MTENEGITSAAQERRFGESSSLWPRVLASTAAFSAYLALLGGSLLAIRFWHAGLSVTQAVSAVPLATLITTAIIELFIPAVGVVIMGIIYGLIRVGWKDDAPRLRAGLSWLLTSVAVVAIVVPVNLYGAALLLSLIVMLIFLEWGIPTITALPGATRRRTM